MTPRHMILLDVIEAAKDAGDRRILGFARELLMADRLGWKKHVSAKPEMVEKWQVVRTFAAI